MFRRLWYLLCLFAFLLVPLGANTAKALELTVMTRNLYVGTDLEKPLSLSSSELPIAVAEAWATFQLTKYGERMAAIAEEICSASPHLVGLQEVMLLRSQSPGDSLDLLASTPAEHLEADFLETLLADLDAECEHLRYHVVATVQDVDVEMPMVNPYSASGYDDLRLTDHEVILARGDVGTSNAAGGTYAAALHYKTATIPRGWVAVDAEIDGATVRFASTHLESVPTVRHAQGVELIRILARESRPLILLGDFNTAAPGNLTYQFFLGAGYTDWPGPDPGYTCCQRGDLNDPVSRLDERIDIVFTRNIAPTGESILIGVTPAAQQPFWPSDHAGVVTSLEFAPAP
jgi:endonuclease/exonuclease/phosphatase family metal-dependent hydrolase